MENSLIPELRFPEFEGQWNVDKVGDLCDFIVPGRNKPKKFDGNIPWITTPDIDNYGFISKSKSELAVSTEEANNAGAKIVPKNSVIMSCVGELGILAMTKNPLIINQQLHAFLPKEGIHNWFLLYELSTKKKYMEMVATKTAVPYMNKNNCNSIPIYYPTRQEQTKIANSLTAVDKRITLLKKKKAELEQYKKGVMQKLFSQSIRFKDENGNDFPDWEEKKLGKVCDIVKGKQLNASELTEKGTYPAINGGIQPSGYTEDWNTVEDTITISEGGNSCGYVNFIKTKFWSGGHCYSLLNIGVEILNEFLYQSLKYNQNQIMKLRVGSGLPNIQKGDVANYKILLPHKSEQQKIASFLSSIDKKIGKTEQQIEESTKFKQGLLQKMFV